MVAGANGCCGEVIGACHFLVFAKFLNGSFEKIACWGGGEGGTSLLWVLLDYHANDG